jgi:hypothetical protein
VSSFPSTCDHAPWRSSRQSSSPSRASTLPSSRHLPRRRPDGCICPHRSWLVLR